MEVRRLHPDPAAVTVEALAGSLELGERAPEGRPYLVCNMAATADGQATVGGRSGPIGGAADHALFHALRGQVDAVLVGARTLRVERYGRLVRDPAAREARAARGLAPDPIACVVSHSGRVPFDVPLFEDPESTVVLYTAVELETPRCPATVRVTRMAAGELTLAGALGALRRDHGVRSVLCEGGPTLLRSLLEERVIDELFLTVAPQLAGGEPALTIVAGAALPQAARLELAWVLESEGELLVRYTVPSEPGE